MPIDDAQKEVLRKRLELARASKVAKKQKINDVVQAPKAEVVEEEPEPKQVQEEKESVITKVIEKAPQPLVELPKKVKAKEDTEGAFSKKDRYAKLVFYKDPSQKTIKKMTSILASSDDDEPPTGTATYGEKAPAKQVNIAPPTPQVKPQPDPRLLRQQQISNLSKRFFDC
jgi:hypothetical protein